ncbi:22373_t:CDS:2, partial [Gigaspora margarita]
VVNKAYWKEMDQYVACKTLTNMEDINDKHYTVFMNKLKMYIDLNLCENIIDFWESLKRYFLVMEFANNSDLYTFLQLNYDSLNWNQRLNLAFQIARGLSVLHSKGIIHRDLHDTNILIDNREAKITDFGHARNDNMETNVHNSLFGAISFLAPELLERSSNPRKLLYCKKMDIYSLGFLLWELASSHRPFVNTSSFGSMDITSFCISIINSVREEIVSRAPEGYINLYSKCWKTNKDERPEIETVYQDLKKLKDIENSEISQSIDPITINHKIPGFSNSQLKFNYNNLIEYMDDKLETSTTDINALGSERLCPESHPNGLSQQYIPTAFKQSPPDESHVSAVLTTAWIQ